MALPHLVIIIGKAIITRNELFHGASGTSLTHSLGRRVHGTSDEVPGLARPGLLDQSVVRTTSNRSKYKNLTRSQRPTYSRTVEGTVGASLRRFLSADRGGVLERPTSHLGRGVREDKNEDMIILIIRVF